MLKVIAIVSLMVSLVFLAGCRAASTPVANDSSKVIPVTGLANGSGENVIRPIDPLRLSAINSNVNSGSGENVARPVLSPTVLSGAASSSGENVVPPPETMGYQALYPSNP